MTQTAKKPEKFASISFLVKKQKDRVGVPLNLAYAVKTYLTEKVNARNI
jgi:hypothetical protein